MDGHCLFRKLQAKTRHSEPHRHQHISGIVFLKYKLHPPFGLWEGRLSQ